ncbi:acyltransferase [Halobacteriales archaeon SW_12_69_24]|nr:MAG: acyltransferase [Halobacteriales archaeon SW_12_69_24]
MFGSDPLEELAIPDGTHVEEHDLVTDGDVLVGGQSDVELGVRGGTVLAGERVTFGGDIEADGDCRLDMWCDVDGNVLVGQDAYLGERVHITGQLIVSGDLDIGDDVDIERGFEANGWIVIRNPMPTIVFLFVYLSQLLRLGEEEAAEEVVETFLTDDREADPVLVPRGASVSDDAWRVSTPATIGDDCRMHGNVRATDIEVGADTEIFGSLRARETITVGPRTVVHGDVTTKGGDVVVAPAANVRGDISCADCELAESADVEGAIRAGGETSFLSDPSAFSSPDLAAVEDGTADRAAASDGASAASDGASAASDGASAASDGASAASDDEATPLPGDLDPAVVPLGAGDLDPAVVPLGAGDLEAQTDPAVVPLADSDRPWSSRRRGRRSGARR